MIKHVSCTSVPYHTSRKPLGKHQVLREPSRSNNTTSIEILRIESNPCTMATPAHSSMQLRHSIEDLIRGTADLDRVNQKLLKFGFFSTRVGSVVSGKPVVVFPMIEHPRSCKAEILNVNDEPNSDTSQTLTQPDHSSSSSDSTLPKYLDLVSPDSNVPCQSADCPIKGIPHNLGRYFHKGEQYESPSASFYRVTLAGVMEDVSDAFNRTVPPPEIISAYLNIRECKDKATKADLDLVRGYQKHHMWSPMSSKPSTPCSRKQYPNMHGLHGHMQPGNSNYLATDDITSVFDHDCGAPSIGTDGEPKKNTLGSFFFEGEGKSRSLLPSDFDDSDDEADVLSSPHGDDALYDGDDEASERTNPFPGFSKDSYISRSITREIPQGHELASAKQRTQEKILRQIAIEDARQAVGDASQ